MHFRQSGSDAELFAVAVSADEFSVLKLTKRKTYRYVLLTNPCFSSRSQLTTTVRSPAMGG